MAEPVYKKITELDTLSASLDGNETLPIVKSGKTYRRTWANFFGSGWITSLLGAFTAFKAPDANHADDADTVGGESTAQLHAAGSLTGALNLAVIPAELTGKNAATATTSAACSGNAATATLAATSAACSGNAATATLAATATNALACSGNAATATVSASCSGNAATAGGVNFITGTIGVPGYQAVALGSPWVIPSGLYMMVGDFNNVMLEILIINPGGSPAWSATQAAPAGLILSDGSNYRIRMTLAGSSNVYYRKLA